MTRAEDIQEEKKRLLIDKSILEYELISHLISNSPEIKSIENRINSITASVALLDKKTLALNSKKNLQ